MKMRNIAFVGDGCVGKTCLITRHLTDTYEPTYVPTLRLLTTTVLCSPIFLIVLEQF